MWANYTSSSYKFPTVYMGQKLKNWVRVWLTERDPWVTVNKVIAMKIGRFGPLVSGRQ